MQNNLILSAKKSADYELLDSGDGVKLERFGKIILSRPDPQALWSKSQPIHLWQKADGIFSRGDETAKWILNENVPTKWMIEYSGLKFVIKPSAFKHTGLFPEQAPQWDWIRETISKSGRSKISVLNLFGYTGGASLASAQAGAEVTHLDGSKSAIGWARENAEASGLSDKPIRWILDDARAFLKREIKRGNKYDAIIMDPPAFGRGPKSELWKIEEDFLPFMKLVNGVLSDNPLFLIINGYASGYSPIVYAENVEAMMKKFQGQTEMGELTIEETNSKRNLPAGIFARWRK